MDKVPVSVLIPTLNEEDNLPRCLGSVKWADEIYVVDSGSTDKTGEIAARHGAKVVQFNFTGTWPKKYNWSLDNLSFSNEWVFILDADEVLTPECESEIREICASDHGSCEGYYINRRFMFMGKWLRHSYYPNWNLRLFKRGLGRFEKLTDAETSSGDIEIHENLVVNGRVGYLKSEMEHYAYPSVAAFVEKHARYARWEAHVMLGDRFTLSTGPRLGSKRVTLRRWLKVISRHLPFRGVMRFVYIFILRLGFLDGREGFYFARLHQEYEFLIDCNVFEIKHGLKK